ncbi:DUF6988 family protein [Thiomicrorhabdus lithotrophica]|uniref:HEPN AbiU2-like domain-containing protein n=1 Tax=Thiomicrorhabdus lithotrophica TaxID=2949997 RepID=A0ABY8C8K0_9GAMM|nr:hypothetical protein [Thiomicrorhabdus lithotrophica]WEJ61872.1 hypothetical protein NR989_07575 [Thiomicrorhabdus lithotrophica]
MEKLITRSQEFHELMEGLLNYSPYEACLRGDISRVLSSAAFEHAESIRGLLLIGNASSAASLLRLQYEYLVRAIWITHSAPDLIVEKLSAELNSENAKKANKLPMLSKMLEDLEKTGPKNAVDPLIEFKTYLWKELSSFVHGGFHLIHRHGDGYPDWLVETILRSSNNLNGMNGYFISIMTGDIPLSKSVHASFEDFMDCCIPKPKTQ